MDWARPGEIRRGRWFRPVLPLELFPRRPLFAEDRREGDSKAMIPPATGGTDDPNPSSLNPNDHKKLRVGKNGFEVDEAVDFFIYYFNLHFSEF